MCTATGRNVAPLAACWNSRSGKRKLSCCCGEVTHTNESVGFCSRPMAAPTM